MSKTIWAFISEKLFWDGELSITSDSISESRVMYEVSCEHVVRHGLLITTKKYTIMCPISKNKLQRGAAQILEVGSGVEVSK